MYTAGKMPMQSLHQLLVTRMSRRQFLQTLGLGLLMVIGFGVLAKFFKPRPHTGTSPDNTTYGGH